MTLLDERSDVGSGIVLAGRGFHGEYDGFATLHKFGHERLDGVLARIEKRVVVCP